MEDIGLRFKISTTRVFQIINKNRHLIKIDKEHEKIKRLNHLRALLAKHPDTMAKKSTLDIIEQLRQEVEGVRPTTQVAVGVTVNNKVGSNGTFTGEDKELQNRLRTELFGGKV
jgi:hypothetical protein